MNKPKIVQLLIENFSSVYCYSCKGNDADDEEFCDDCHRKYMNWALAEHEASRLADEILGEVK